VVHPRATCNSGVAAALSRWATENPRPKGAFAHRAFRFNHRPQAGVSRRFLTPSLLRLWYPLVEPALLPLHRACFHPASNRPEDFRGPLILEPAHGADLGCLDDVVKALVEMEIVEEMHSLAGEYDLIVKVRVEDFDHLARLVVDRIQRVQHLRETKTLIAFDAYNVPKLRNT
jgi:Lrp/AsnC ligand binding domain